MSHALVIINGHIRLDEDLTHWQHRDRPPELLLELAKRGSKPEPYMQAVAIALADALQRQRSITMEVTATDIAWTMNVHHSTAPRVINA